MSHSHPPHYHGPHPQIYITSYSKRIVGVRNSLSPFSSWQAVLGLAQPAEYILFIDNKLADSCKLKKDGSAVLKGFLDQTPVKVYVQWKSLSPVKGNVFELEVDGKRYPMEYVQKNIKEY